MTPLDVTPSDRGEEEAAVVCSYPPTLVIPDDDEPELRAEPNGNAGARGQDGDGAAGGAPALLFAPGPDTPEARARARKATERFLRTLDPAATRFDFRAIDDRKPRHATKLFTNAILDHALPELWRLNQLGYGIFIMVNATDGRGQKGANVTRVRAIIADCDGVDPSALVAAMAPHMAVGTSPGKCHLWWLTDDAPPKLFAPLHEALIGRYATDKSVKDLPRVLRLPGFYHNKATPHPVKFDYALAPKANMELPRYGVQAIIHGLGLDVRPAAARSTAADDAFSRKPSMHAAAGEALNLIALPSEAELAAVARATAGKLPLPAETLENVAIVEAMLAKLDPNVPDREPWRDAVWAVLATRWERAEELARAWSMKGTEQWDEAAFAGVVASFEPNRPDGVGFGKLIFLAEAAGYIGPRPGQAGAIAGGRGMVMATAGDGQGRPVIMVEQGEIASTASKAEDALRSAGVPIYQRGGELVFPVQSRSRTAGGKVTITASFKEVTVPMLVDWLNRCADFQRYDGRSKKIVSVNPPRDVAELILSRRGEWGFLPVSGCVTAPLLRPDGTLLEAAGYDSATELHHFLDLDLDMPAIADAPTRADAEGALTLLGDPLAGFPFVGPIDRAVALSALMTAVLRGGMATAPMHVIRAHAAGTGKSLLVDIATTLAAGQAWPASSVGTNPEELEKRLGALLLDGSPFMNLDNVNGMIGGDTLCQATERPSVATRVLGLSKMPRVECRAMIFCNGNNTTVAGDLVRRTVTCNLDAGVENPERRSFAFDPLARVRADRGRYLAAVLTIAKAYRAAGCPDVCLPPLGSYGDWTTMVRAPLVWLGMSDPVASQEAAREEDPVRASIREVIAVWEASPKLGVSTFYKAKEISEAALFDLNLGECLHRHCGVGSNVSVKALGTFLTSIHGQVLDGRRIMMRADTKHGNRYALARVEGMP